MQLLRDQKLVLPADFALLFRVLLRLQGLGRGVRDEVRVTELLEPYVKSMIAQRFDPRRIGRELAGTGRGWDRLATALPGDVQDVLERIRAGNLGLHLRIHDPDGAVDHLVDGLVAWRPRWSPPRNWSLAGPGHCSGHSRCRDRHRGRRDNDLATAGPQPDRASLLGQPRPRIGRGPATASHRRVISRVDPEFVRSQKTDGTARGPRPVRGRHPTPAA